MSRRAGLAAGLTFAALPAVSWFAQDARPFAMETAAGAAASYFLVRLAGDDGRRRWAYWYAASLVALGLANVFGLLLIPAHAVTLAAWQRPAPPAGPGPPVASRAAGHRRRGAAPADRGGLDAAVPDRVAAPAGSVGRAGHRAAGRLGRAAAGRGGADRDRAGDTRRWAAGSGATGPRGCPRCAFPGWPGLR